MRREVSLFDMCHLKSVPYAKRTAVARNVLTWDAVTNTGADEVSMATGMCVWVRERVVRGGRALPVRGSDDDVVMRLSDRWRRRRRRWERGMWGGEEACLTVAMTTAIMIFWKGIWR